MAILSVRQLSFEKADGQTNMAADETMLVSATEGIASFRLYGWSECTLSLGYFQPQDSRNYHPQLVPLPYVRRPSGGLTLVHQHEITYAIALPDSHQLVLPYPTWVSMIHRIIIGVLSEFGVTATMAAEDGPTHDDPLCFKHITKGDLLIGTDKIVGSAQRKLRGALLQHGGILLSQSPATPTLPGLFELSGKSVDPEEFCDLFAQAVKREMSWRFHAGDWTEEEKLFKQKSIREKFSRKKWNDKR
ncbi:MAG: biotin/lipoate A/B protein ligase family protein [Gemmataceae bacterium]